MVSKWTRGATVVDIVVDTAVDIDTRTPATRTHPRMHMHVHARTSCWPPPMSSRVHSRVCVCVYVYVCDSTALSLSPGICYNAWTHMCGALGVGECTRGPRRTRNGRWWCARGHRYQASESESEREREKERDSGWVSSTGLIVNAELGSGLQPRGNTGTR